MAADWELVVAERTDLLTLLETLPPDQWETPSLCAGWRVRDVAAHLVSATDYRVVDVLVGLVRHRGDFDAFMGPYGRKRGSAPVPDILRAFRAAVPSRRTPPRTPPATVLVDTVVHHQDIRRPLDLPRTVPAERLVRCLEHVHAQDLTGGPGGRFVGGRRVEGLRVSATDVGWAAGAGPVVEGPGEALLLAMTGRPAALPELAGPGLPTLVARVAPAAAAR